MAIDRKYGKVRTDIVDAFADDEPVFIIRAKDSSSISALLAYAEKAYNQGASATFIDDVMSSVKRFSKWQDEHRDEIKTPD